MKLRVDATLAPLAVFKPNEVHGESIEELVGKMDAAKWLKLLQRCAPANPLRES